MARFPTITELRKRAEFLNSEAYLHSVLNNHPRIGALPSLLEAFTGPKGGAAGTDQKSAGQVVQRHPPQAALTAPATPGVTPSETVAGDQSDSKGASGKQAGETLITPALITKLISVWTLSAAQSSARSNVFGGQSGGLYLLRGPASAIGGVTASAPFEAVLNDEFMQALWRGDVPPFKAPSLCRLQITVRSLPHTEDAAKKAASGRSNNKQFTQIHEELQDGQRIYLLCPNSRNIPPDLAALVLGTIDLPAIDLDMIYGLHRMLYPKGPRLSVEAFAALPAFDAISHTDLALALRFDQATPAAETLTKLIKSRQGNTPVDPGPRLEDLIGNRAAVTLGLQICADLLAWKQGRLDWRDVPNGVMFVGPPGCGKTLLAKALAQSCSFAFLSVSYSDLVRGNSSGGNGIIQELSNTGAEAAGSGGAVVFIDEIDGFGQSRFNRQDHNSSYYRTLTTALLRFCDNMRQAPGVILIAATNDCSAVDPALQRAGRFDHHISLTTPDLPDIETLLARELPTLPQAAITQAARRLLGSSFAEVTTVAQNVRSHARMQGAAPDAVHLADVLDRRAHWDFAAEEDLFRIAVHEAGHVIVSYAQAGTVVRKVILSTQNSSVSRRGPVNFTDETLNNELSIMLAGRAAERLVLGSVGSGSGSGLDSDLARATHLALIAQQNWHLAHGTDLIWRDVPQRLSDPIDPAVRGEITQLLRNRERAAYDILVHHKNALVQFAQALITAREMHQGEIETLLRTLIPEPLTDGKVPQDQVINDIPQITAALTRTAEPDQHGAGSPSGIATIHPAANGLSAPTDQ